MNKLVTFSEKGLYCPHADVYIDPWRPVERAIVTHAHADHSRWGMQHYLAHTDSVPVMKHRLGADISIESKAYGETFTRNGVTFSLHPAGHIVGSAQVRIEYQGEVWVISGDYKTDDDGTCAPFEPVACHHFVTESTFGLPVYDWKPASETYAAINDWWRQNREAGKTSVILCYALGKAQRIIQHLDESIGTIYTHGAVENTNEVLRQADISVKPTVRVTQEIDKKEFPGHIVVAPPSAHNSPWMRRFGTYETAITSGWMALRGARRRRNADRGFVLSDHADWKGLNAAIEATGAEHIYVTHGYTSIFSQWLREQGYDAHVVETEYEGELSEIGESSLENEAPEAA